MQLYNIAEVQTTILCVVYRIYFHHFTKNKEMDEGFFTLQEEALRRCVAAP